MIGNKVTSIKVVKNLDNCNQIGRVVNHHSKCVVVDIVISPGVILLMIRSYLGLS